MQIITRKIHDRIIIGEPPNQIELCIVNIKGDSVLIGTEAQKHMDIFRA